MLKIDAQEGSIDEKEVTAYVQQQMAELGPHLAEKTALQVRLTQIGESFEAEVTAYHTEGEVQTVGRNSDIFDAIRFAKEGLLEYFVEVEAEMHPRERDEKINYLSRHGNLYLH